MTQGAHTAHKAASRIYCKYRAASRRPADSLVLPAGNWRVRFA